MKSVSCISKHLLHKVKENYKESELERKPISQLLFHFSSGTVCQLVPLDACCFLPFSLSKTWLFLVVCGRV